MTRRATPEIVNGLKTAFKRVVSDLGGLVAAASCTRVGVSQLSDYGKVACDKMPPVDVVLDLEAISEQPHITAELARLQGYELLPLDTRPPHELVACLQRISEDNGKLFGQAVRCLSAGSMTAAEFDAMMSELSDVIDAAREARAALSRGRP